MSASSCLSSLLLLLLLQLVLHPTPVQSAADDFPLPTTSLQTTSDLFYDPTTGAFSPPLLTSRVDLPSPFLFNVSFVRPEGVRWFYLFLSSKVVASSTQSVPLTFSFHGYGGTAASALQGSGVMAAADAAGWAVIAGQGTLGPSPLSSSSYGWNAGTCCTFQQTGAPVYEPDDVAFTIIALNATTQILATYDVTVDPNRSSTPLTLHRRRVELSILIPR